MPCSSKEAFKVTEMNSSTGDPRKNSRNKLNIWVLVRDVSDKSDLV